MKRICNILLILIWSINPIFAFSNKVLIVTATQSIVDRYEKFIIEKGGDPLQISDYKSKCSQRAVVDIVLIQQALHLADMEIDIEFLIVPNPIRGQITVKTGKAAMFAHDIWEENFDNEVYKSYPIIRKGEYEALIFTLPKNEGVLSVQSLEDLKNYKPVISQSWTKDIKTLRDMGFSDIILPNRYDLIFRTIDGGRGDFTLLSGSELNQSRAFVDDIILYPVIGIKIQYPFSRHFMISKKYPDGKEIHKALNRGLVMLRKKGIIFKAMSECGFINVKIKDWKVLNPNKE